MIQTLLHPTQVQHNLETLQTCNGNMRPQIRSPQPHSALYHAQAPYTRNPHEDPTQNDPSIDPQQQNKGALYMLRGMDFPLRWSITCHHGVITGSSRGRGTWSSDDPEGQQTRAPRVPAILPA